MVQMNVISQLLQQQGRPADAPAEPQAAGGFAALFAALAPVSEAASVKHSLLSAGGPKTAPRDDLITLPEQPPGPPIFAAAVALPVPVAANDLPVPPAAVSSRADSGVPLPVAPQPLAASGKAAAGPAVTTPVEPLIPAQTGAAPATLADNALVAKPAPTTALFAAEKAAEKLVQVQPQLAEQAVKAADRREMAQPVVPTVTPPVSQLAATATMRPGSTPELTAKPVSAIAPASGGIQIVMTEAPVVANAPASSPQPPSQTAAPQLTATVGSQAWQNQLQQNMVQMVMHNQQQVTLRLNPADLGPIQMQLQLDDTSAQLNILTHSHQVRGALEMAMPQLRDALASQGIQLTDSQVGQQGSQQQQSQQSSQQRGMQWSAASGESVPAGDPASLSSPSGDSEQQGQVDIYA